MPYAKTVYVNDNPPAINAENLNKSENAIAKHDEIIDEISNEVNYFKLEDKQYAGVTIQNTEDNCIIINGTANGTVDFPIATLKGTFTGMYITVSGTVTPEVTVISLRAGDNRWLNSGNRLVTLSFSTDTNIVLRLNNNAVFTNFKIKMIINQGNTASESLDYNMTAIDNAARNDIAALKPKVSDLQSSVGHDDQTVASGPNDFSIKNTCYLSDGTKVTRYTGFNITDFIPCIPGDYIDIKLVGFNRTISGKTIILSTVTFFDEDKNFVSSYYINYTSAGAIVTDTIVIPSGARFMVGMTNDSVLTDPHIIIKASGLYSMIEHRESKQLKLAFIGDSLTQGVSGGTPGVDLTFVDKPYPTVLKEFLNSIGYDVTIKNFGRRGLSAKSYWNEAIPPDGNWHSPASGEPGDTINFDNTFDAVIIMLGTNGNLNHNTIDEDTQIGPGETYEDYADTQCGDYCKIIEYVMENTSNHAQIILIAPIYSTDSQHEQKMIDTLPVVKALGERYQVPVINALYESGLGKFNTSAFYNATDLLHLNQNGYKKLGTFIGSRYLSFCSLIE